MKDTQTEQFAAMRKLIKSLYLYNPTRDSYSVRSKRGFLSGSTMAQLFLDAVKEEE